jgi:hypothetical protein
MRAGTQRHYALACGVGAAMLALLPVSAYSQAKGDLRPQRSEQQKREDAAIDKAYKESLKRSRTEPAVKIDPWQTIRPAGNDATKR